MSGVGIREEAPRVPVPAVTPLFPAKSNGTKVTLAIWFAIWLPVLIYLVNLTGYDSVVSTIWAAWWTGMTLGISLGIAEIINTNRFNLREKIMTLLAFKVENLHVFDINGPSTSKHYTPRLGQGTIHAA